jgi:hypothetical protein
LDLVGLASQALQIGFPRVDVRFAQAVGIRGLMGRIGVSACFGSTVRRMKDAPLQQHVCFVLRFLAEDVGKHLDLVLDAVLTALVHRAKNRGNQRKNLSHCSIHILNRGQ